MTIWLITLVGDNQYRCGWCTEQSATDRAKCLPLVKRRHCRKSPRVRSC